MYTVSLIYLERGLYLENKLLSLSANEVKEQRPTVTIKESRFELHNKISPKCDEIYIH